MNCSLEELFNESTNLVQQSGIICSHYIHLALEFKSVTQLNEEEDYEQITT